MPQSLLTAFDEIIYKYCPPIPNNYSAQNVAHDKNKASDYSSIDEEVSSESFSIIREYYRELAKNKEWIWEGKHFSLEGNIWDFSYLNPMKDKRFGYKLIFDARNITEEELLLAKLFTIYIIEKRGKYQPAIIQHAHTILRILAAINHIGKTVFTVTENESITILDEITEKSRYAVTLFFSYILDVFGVNLCTPLILQTVKHRRYIDHETRKTPLMPTRIYTAVRTFFTDMVFQASLSTKREQALACTAIQMCTGLRISEICRLEFDCLITVDGNENQAILAYYGTKNGGAKPIRRYIPLNDTATKIIRKLQSLPGKRATLLTIMISGSNVSDFYYRALLADNNYISLGLDKPWDGGKIKTLNGKSFYPPTFTQFRVYHQTLLRHEGVTPRVIGQMFGNMNVAMEDWYNRALHQMANDPHQTIDIAQSVIKTEKMLGPKAHLREEQIKDIMTAKKGGKAEKNIEKLADLLGTAFQIRRKSCGYCILSTGRSCDKDQDTDEYDCAYGRCANTIHFYYNLPDNWKECEKLIFTFTRASDAGQTITAAKEYQKLHRMITSFILPELQNLKEVLQSEDPIAVIADHPQMEDFVKPEMIETIEKAIKRYSENPQVSEVTI